MRNLVSLLMILFILVFLSCDKRKVNVSTDFTWSYFDFDNTPELPNDYFWDIAVDLTGDIWICTNENGLINYSDGNWLVYNSQNSPLPGNRLVEIFVDSNNNKWISGWGSGVVKFDGIDWIFYSFNDTVLLSNLVTQIDQAPNGDMWMASGRGLVRYHEQNWSIMNTDNSDMLMDEVKSLKVDNDGNVWFSQYSEYGSAGISKYNGYSILSYNFFNSPLSETDRIYSLDFDKSNNVWMGSHGIIKLNANNHAWDFYTSENSGMTDDIVSEIKLDKFGMVWSRKFSTNINDPGRLIIKNEDEYVIHSISDMVPGCNENIKSFAFDRSGNVWIVSSHKIIYGKRGSKSSDNKLPTN